MFTSFLNGFDVIMNHVIAPSSGFKFSFVNYSVDSYVSLEYNLNSNTERHPNRLV